MWHLYYYQLLIWSTFFLFLGFLILLIKNGQFLNIIMRSRNRFKTLLDLSPYGMALTDKQGIIISANKAIADMIGREIRDTIGLNLPAAFGLDPEKFSRATNELESGQVFNFPLVSLKDTKSGVPIHVKPCLFFDSKGKDILFWHISDQTKRFQLEKRFSELIKNVPVGLFWTDLDGTINLANPAFEEIFTEGHIPSSMAELLNPKGWQSISTKLMEEDGVQETGIILWQDGKRVNLSLKIKLCEYGGMPCLAGILKDVTEQVRLNESLEEAYRKAEAASNAKTIFLSHMSHELRTPLNVIQGMASLLVDRVSEPSVKELVVDLKKASELLTSLIGDILDLAKIESGRLELNDEPFDMKLLLEDLESVLGVQAHLKDLHFITRLEDTAGRFYCGDPLRIRQVIFNLAGNSVKLTKQGGIEIIVRGKGQSEDGRERVEILVSDTGPGIPPHALPGLFDPFFQAEDGRKAGGTGLGLSITKELVELMDGHITVDSIPGSGTTFIVQILLAKADKKDIPAPKENLEEIHMKPATALVVDDVGMNRKVLRMFLEKMGWKVKEAGNGQEALDILETGGDCQIIFMDISMPVMDGIEATARIRQRKDWGHIPIIAVTAHAMAEDRERFLQAGMDGYISKPVKFDRLYAEMARFLDRGQPETSTRGTAGADAQKPRGQQVISEEMGSEILDFKSLVKTCQGMEDLAKDLVADLVKECPKWLKETEEAVAAGDEARIRKVCHLVKGTAMTVHAKCVHEAAAALGQAAREGRVEEIPGKFLDFKVAVSDLERWVRGDLMASEGIAKIESISQLQSEESLSSAA